MAYTSCFRVYFEDTDAGGVVYHASYLRFMERSRTDWLAEFCCQPNQPADLWGVIMAVRSAQLEYLRPARLGDLLTVSVALEAMRGASLYLSQAVHRDASLLVQAEFKIACVDAQRLAPRRIPAELREKLSEWITH